MEGESPLVKEGGSLPPNLPLSPRTSPMSPPFLKWKFVSLFENGGDMGEVFCVWGGNVFFAECGCRTLFVGGIRFVGILYTSAEIPPAGAPSGFDSAAMVGFGVRRYTVVPLRSE